MRSLEEWTKYVEEQEKELQESLQHETPQDEPESHGVTRSSPVDSSADNQPGESTNTQSPGSPTQTSEDISPPPKASKASTAHSSQKAKSIPKSRKKVSSASPEIEVAQRSYSKFKETREELLQRLLDPQINLEEAARILNVCPTTVRRYTNRGLLKHFRTAGNQRRFRLSDVIEFMEAQGRSLKDNSPNNTSQ